MADRDARSCRDRGSSLLTYATCSTPNRDAIPLPPALRHGCHDTRRADCLMPSVFMVLLRLRELAGKGIIGRGTGAQGRRVRAFL